METSELMKLMDDLSIKCDTAVLDKVADFIFSEDKLQIITALNWKIKLGNHQFKNTSHQLTLLE